MHFFACLLRQENSIKCTTFFNTYFSIDRFSASNCTQLFRCPTILRRQGAVQASGRVAGLTDIWTRITESSGNGFQTTARVRQRVGLWHLLRSDVIDKLHHTKLLLLIKLKTQNLHQDLLGQAQCFCQFCRWNIPEPEFWKHNFVSYGDLSFPCFETFFVE